MLRRLLFLGVGAVALLVALGVPGQARAQGMRGGMTHAMAPQFRGGIMPGSQGGMMPGSRGGFVPGSRGGFSHRFPHGGPGPRVFPGMFEPRFNGGMFDHRFNPGFRSEFFPPF
jgi:hypothetical protein